MKKIINNLVKLYQNYKEIINYLFFGGCTALVNFISYYIPSNIFRN